MNKISFWATSLVFSIFSVAVSASPGNIVYDFSTSIYPVGSVSIIDVDGDASGRLTTKYSESAEKFVPLQFVLKLENQPEIIVNGFSASGSNSNRYSAHVKNVWIYRSLKVTLDSPEGYSSPEHVYAEIFVDLNESYVNTNNGISDFDDGYRLLAVNFYPEVRENFSAIDVYKTMAENKRVILKLNKNLVYAGGNSPFPVGQPLMEMKVTWFGHGEGLFYIPVSVSESSSIAPYAIVSDSQMMPGVEMIKIKYRDYGLDLSLDVPLDTVLTEAFQNINNP